MVPEDLDYLPLQAGNKADDALPSCLRHTIKAQPASSRKKPANEQSHPMKEKQNPWTG